MPVAEQYWELNITLKLWHAHKHVFRNGLAIDIFRYQIRVQSPHGKRNCTIYTTLGLGVTLMICIFFNCRYSRYRTNPIVGIVFFRISIHIKLNVVLKRINIYLKKKTRIRHCKLNRSGFIYSECERHSVHLIAYSCI